MNLKRILLLVIIFFQIGLNAECQTVGYFTGDKIQPDTASYQLYSYDSKKLYVFRTNSIGLKSNYTLQVYSRDSLKQLDTIPVPFVSTNSLVYQLKHLLIHKDYYQLLYSWYNASSQKAKLEMVNFDSEGKKIGETITVDSSVGWNASKAGEFYVYNVPENNEFICYTEKYVKGKLMINIDHFNYEGKKIKTTNFDNVRIAFIAHEFADRDGGIFFVTRGRTDASNDWKLRIFSPVSDTAFNIEFKKANEVKLYLHDQFYSFISADSNLYLLTPYSDNEDSKYSEGLYVVKVDLKNHTLAHDEFIPFTKNINGVSDDDDDEGSFSISSCFLKQVVELPDGRMNILFESSFQKNETFSTEYVIGNIFSVEIDSSFKTLSVCRINKKQVFTNRGNIFTGFFPLVEKEKLFLIYNDLKENSNPEGKIKALRSFNLNEASAAIVTLENNKINQKQELIRKKYPGLTDALLIRSALRTDDNEVYMLRQIDKSVYLTKIFVKED
jgi:hypothetical protein